MSTIIRNDADMKAQRANKISFVLRSLGTELELRQRKAGESNISEAIPEASTDDRSLWGIPKSVSGLQQHLKHLDKRFLFQIDYCSREIRNRHFLERNLVELPSNAAHEAVAADPGLQTIRSWDIADDRMFLLIRYDAVCAFCGKSFELKVLKTTLEADPSWRNDAPEKPHAPVACPHCGWTSALDNIIKTLELKFDETGIRTIPHPVSPAMSWTSYCWHGETEVDPIDFEINWERGKIAYTGEDVTYSGVPDAVMFRLAQFPIVPAALEALDTFNPDVLEALPKPIKNLESLIAAVRD